MIEPEIRSQVSILKSSRFTPQNAYEIVGDAVLKALDAEPLWNNHLLTKRRPNMEEISWTLADVFKWMAEYIIIPFEDLVVVIRLSSASHLEVCAVMTVEPTYAGGEIGYWLRCSIYEGSESTSMLVGFVRSMATFYEVLDYPDANLIDSLNYSFVSKAPIAAYATHHRRTQTLFIIPKSGTDSRARKVTRVKMAGALLPYGIIGELGLDDIRALTGIMLPKEICAIALPPSGSASSGPRIVIEAPNVKEDEKLIWAGMADYLSEIDENHAPWLSDSYAMVPARNAAGQYARLITNSRSCSVRPYRLDKNLAEHIKTTTEQPGWDLYAPLPMEEHRGDYLEKTELPAVGINLEASEVDTKTVAETALNESAAENTVATLGQAPQDEVGSGYPSSLHELPTWVERRLSSALEIAPRAIREMKKSRHPEPERIAEALELLASSRLANYRGDRSASRAFHQGLATLRMRDGFSGAERLAGRTGSDYLLSHRGKTYHLERHLASNSSGFNDPKMIRIYYFYDHDSDKIIVGWLPSHLQTSKS